MPKIVISYRRSDVPGVAGRIFDRLVQRYGEESVFMDVAGIPAGADYRSHIRGVLEGSDIVIAVIGPNWRGPKQPDPGATEAGGGEQKAWRINEPNDLVRVEVEIALERRVTVIPVQIGDAPLPEARDLPPELGDLAYRQSVRVDPGVDFHPNMDRLIHSIDRVLKGAHPSAFRLGAAGGALARVKGPLSGIGIGAVLAIAILAVAKPAFLTAWLPSQSTSPPAATPAQQAQTPVAPPAPQMQPKPQPAPPDLPLLPPQLQPEPVRLPPGETREFVKACGDGAPAAFVDDFKKRSEGWGLEPGRAFYADGTLRVKAEKNKGQMVIYWPLTYRNVTACTDIQTPDNITDAEGTSAGLMFWIKDRDNFYWLDIYSDGNFGVERMVKGSFVKTPVLKDSYFVGMRTGSGVTNRLKLVLEGNTATIFINDMKAQSFRGSPPSEPTPIGLYAESEKKQEIEWRFLNFTLVEKR